MTEIIKTHRYIYLIFFILILVSQTCLYETDRDNPWDSKTARPKFSPEGGAYDTDQLVSITSTTTGATIYYTTDGSKPTTSSSMYLTPIPLTDGTSIIINAIAAKSGLLNSAVTNASYMIAYPKKVTTIAGSAGIGGWEDGTGSNAKFFGPQGITTDGMNLYIADGDTIRKMEISSGEVTTIAGLAYNSGSADGIGSNARFYGLTGITTDGTNLFMTDSYNHTIRKIVISTGEVTTIAGSAGNSGSADGIGSNARFNEPVDITTDGTNLYIADNMNCTIRKMVISSNEVTTVAGSAGNCGCVDGTGSNAKLITEGITTDGINLYISNSSSIRKIIISSGEVTTIAGSANYGSADDTGSNAMFYCITGITTDGTNLYVTDTNNHTIRKIMISSGMVITIAGSAGIIGSADGIGSNAYFNNPQGIIFYGTNLYVADSWNCTIRKIE